MNLEDFLSDASFINWVNHSNQQDVDKWNDWISQNPDAAIQVEEAKSIVLGLTFKKVEISSQEMDQGWDRFLSTIQEKKTNTPSPTPTINRRRWLTIAASFALLLAAGWKVYDYFQAPELITVTTDYEKTQSIKLPDGSTVLLNTNSSIGYYNNWESQKERKITLKGEAFFTITKNQKGKKFLVETPELVVEVLGTTFNINAKRKQPVVSLVEGKIALTKPAIKEKILTTGQTAQFNTLSKSFDIIENQSDYWSSWAFHKWSFGKGIPITEVLEKIKETYNLDYEVKDNDLLQKTASGEIAFEKKEELFEALAFLLQLDVQIKGNKIILAPSITE